MSCIPRILMVSTEEELRQLFNYEDPARIRAGDGVILKKSICLSMDIIIDVPITIGIGAGVVLDTQGYHFITRGTNDWSGEYLKIIKVGG